MAGQQLKGVGVDCIRFGTGFADEMYGYKRIDTPRLPQDMMLHDKKTAMRAMRFIRRLYMPNIIVTDGTIEPGDWLIVGELGGGPGHLMVAGSKPNTLWHALKPGVTQTGMSFFGDIIRIYRAADKEKWLSN